MNECVNSTYKCINFVTMHLKNALFR